MRGSRIPSGKRITNSVAPLDASDMSEANANNLMFLWDNIGTGEYLEDASILARHFANLLPREQASPNLTLVVAAGSATFATTFVSFAGGNSPSFTAPAANPRIDLLCINSSGTLTRTAGAEAGSPTAPAVPVNSIPLCSVYNRVGQTVIHDNDAQVGGQGYILTDLRPFIGIGGGVIKSIQSGTISVAFTNADAAGATKTATATISSVDTTKAFVVFGGAHTTISAGANTQGAMAGVDLTNATTVTASVLINTAIVAGGVTETVIVHYSVVEYL